MKRNIIMTVCGLGMCVGGPLISTLCYMPKFFETGTKTAISGMAILLIILSILPLIKFCKEKAKTGSIPIFAWLLFILAWATKNVINEFYIITFCTAISNTIGFVILIVNKMLNDGKKTIILDEFGKMLKKQNSKEE